MLINLKYPLYNTLIVYLIGMIFLYVLKPDMLYDNVNKEFRQFGVRKNKSLITIHLIALIFPVCLYAFFYAIRQENHKDINNNINNDMNNDTKNEMTIQLQNIQQLNQQLNQQLHQQLIQQLLQTYTNTKNIEAR